MPTSSFYKINQFVEDVAHKVHNLNSDQLVVALCDAAHAPVATNTVLANLTQVAYTYCSSRNLTKSSSGQSSGTYKLVLADLTLTASGGAIGPFRYAVIYNDTPSSPLDPLIGWYDYGADVTIADGESILLNLDDANGVFTLA